MSVMKKRFKLGIGLVGALTAAVMAVSTSPAAAAGDYSGLPYVTGGGTYTDDFGDEGILNAAMDHNRSNAVCLWQRILWAHGYIELRDIDGIFGPKTLDATKKLQHWFNLDPDGNVGKATFGATDNWGSGYNGLQYVSGSEADGQTLNLRYHGLYQGLDFNVTRDGQGHYLFPDRNGNIRAAGYDYLSCS